MRMRIYKLTFNTIIYRTFILIYNLVDCDIRVSCAARGLSYFLNEIPQQHYELRVLKVTLIEISSLVCSALVMYINRYNNNNQRTHNACVCVYGVFAYRTHACVYKRKYKFIGPLCASKHSKLTVPCAYIIKTTLIRKCRARCQTCFILLKGENIPHTTTQEDYTTIIN